MTTLKASSLRGRAVVSLGEAQRLGSVSTPVFDLASGHLRELLVTSGLFGAKRLLTADIQAIGPDAITVNSGTVLQAHHDPQGPERTTLDQLQGVKVLSSAGALLGTLGDVEVDATNWQITGYEMSGTAWERLRHHERTFAEVSGLRFGQGVLIVPDAVAAELSGRTAGEAPGTAG